MWRRRAQNKTRPAVAGPGRVCLMSIRQPPRAWGGVRSSVDDHGAAAILRPSRLVRAEGCRTLLAVADGGDPAGRNALLHQPALHRVGPALAQRQVVLAG